MQKIWLIQSRYDTRVIKKEKEFLKFLQIHSKSSFNFKIKIFTLSEEYDDSKSYYESFITQKERDEQLKTLLEDDSVIATIQKINNLISEHLELNKKGHENSSFKKYLQDIKLLELIKSLSKKLLHPILALEEHFYTMDRQLLSGTKLYYQFITSYSKKNTRLVEIWLR
jgi:hypothetical protein